MLLSPTKQANGPIVTTISGLILIINGKKQMSYILCRCICPDIPIVQFLFQIYLHGWLGFQLARFIGVYQWFFKYLSACVDLKLQNKNYHHISRLQTKWIWTKEKKAKLKIKTNKKLFVIFSCLFAVFNFYHF